MEPITISPELSQLIFYAVAIYFGIYALGSVLLALSILGVLGDLMIAAIQWVCQKTNGDGAT